MSSIPRTISSCSNNIKLTSSIHVSSTEDAATQKVLLPHKPCGLPTASTEYTRENFATEINVNFSDRFMSQEETVPSVIAVESSICQHSKIGRRYTGSCIDSNLKSTFLQPLKEIDVMRPNNAPFQENRNEHLRTTPPTPTFSSKGDSCERRAPTMPPRSNSYGSRSIDLPRRSSINSTERGHINFHNSIITIPMSNVSTAEVSQNSDYRCDAISKQSSAVHSQSQSNSHKINYPKTTILLNLEDVRRKFSPRVDDAAYEKWNTSKSSLKTTNSSKSVPSQRSSSYSTVEQLEESIQNLEATLQMKTSSNENSKRDKECDDQMVNLALASSLNDIYLRPSTSDKRSMMQHRHAQNSQQQAQCSPESFSGISASVISSSMTSSSLLSTMSMNTNNSMLLQQQRRVQQQQSAIPPNLIIPINTITTTTTINNNNYSTIGSSKVDDYSNMETAMALSSAIMDHPSNS